MGQSGEPADQSGREPMMAHPPITSHYTTEVTCPKDDRTTTTDPAVTSTDLFSPATIPLSPLRIPLMQMYREHPLSLLTLSQCVTPSVTANLLTTIGLFNPTTFES